MSGPIIMHVNYCEQGQTIMEICEKAVAWGFDGVEFRRKRARTTESPEEYLDNLAEAVQKTGLKNVLFGSPGPNLASEDEKVREAELEAAAKFFTMAADRFKLTVCNTFAGALVNKAPGITGAEYDKHGSFFASDNHWKWASDGFKELGKLADKLGFKLAFEAHMNYIHDIPEAAKKLVDMIDSPAVGVNLDYGNTVYFKKMPGVVDTIKSLGDKLYYVHLKNSIPAADGKRTPTALAEGEINHREYLKTLKETGYTGPICIEAPRPGDRELYAKNDLAYLKSLLKDLDWE